MSKVKVYEKKFFRVLIALALCSSVFPSAMAADGHVCPHRYHTFGDYTLNGGVGNYGSANRYYWIDASAFLLDYYNHIESTIISLTLWIVSLCMIPAIDIHSSNLRRKKHEKNYLSGMH